jgi:hypothetical protein
MPVAYDKIKVIKPLTQHSWTEDMVQEYCKSARSVKYFMLNHCKVVSVEHGVIKFEMRDYQMRMLTLLDSNKKAILNCPRQCGKSTVVGGYCLWYAMFSTEPESIYILSNKGKSAQSLLDDIKFTYEELPVYLKRGIKEYNKTSIEFDNGSKIQTGTTSKSAIRGETPSLLVLDEFAHVQKHIADEFFTAVIPTISTGGKIYIISTPCGNIGKFYEIFAEAKATGGNGFAAFDMDWREVPGRDDKFKEQMIRATSLQEWKQEFEASFIGSAKTLINPDKLGQLHKLIEEPVSEYENLRVWDKPQQGKIYVLGVDVAKGVEKDSSVIQVFDITSATLTKQVAVYANNLVDPFDFAKKIVEIAKMYNQAYVIVENNTYGHDICRRIYQDFDYDHMYKSRKENTWGIYSDSRTKPLATSFLKKQIEDSTLLVRDKKTYDEICGFIEKAPGVYKCESGKNSHDDHVIALMWVAYFVGSEFWKDLAEYVRNEASGTKEVEQNKFPDQWMPFVIDDDDDVNKLWNDEDLR